MDTWVLGLLKLAGIVVIFGVLIWVCVRLLLMLMLGFPSRGETTWRMLEEKVRRGKMTFDEAEYDFLTRHGYYWAGGEIQKAPKRKRRLRENQRKEQRRL